MAKRSSKSKQPHTNPPAPGGALERQVLAFAEQLGYVAGSIESRAEGWMDVDKLSRQVTSVRDGAKQLLDSLASGVASRVRRKPAPAGPPASMSRTRNTRVSGAAPRARAAGHRPRQG